jgi:acetyl-CoA carboxylase biotin carboxyl carrier protein
MTHDVPAMSADQQPLGRLADMNGMPVDLAQLRKHAVELLAELDRPPRQLRIRAGSITVDIRWPVAADFAETARQEPKGNGSERPAEADDGVVTEYLTSPGVGVFYHASEPGAEPYVSVGSLVGPGQQIGIIEAMKLMIPVQADRAGRISLVLKANSEPVEYDEPLFALEAVQQDADA